VIAFRLVPRTGLTVASRRREHRSRFGGVVSELLSRPMSRLSVRSLAADLCALAAIIGISLTASAQSTASTEPVPPRLVFAFELRARVAAPIEVGQVKHGRRRIVPIEGGTVSGPMLNGAVTTGGADWQVIQPDGFTELDTRYTIQTNKGEIVYVQNPGIRTAAPDVMQKLLSGQVVDPRLVYFRTQPKFETSAAELQWLTTSLFVGVGERFPNEVVIRFFKVE
jgi:hypothetical protein